MSAQTYQVGAHFTALIEGILMAPLKTIEKVFFAFRVPLPDCVAKVVVVANSMPSVYAALLWYNDKRISSIRPPL